jgi:serine/threonine protein kinase
MPLPPGARLGRYEILAPLGAGGMGEVYKAADTRLGRCVAIKVSRDEFSARFEQEARAVAALMSSRPVSVHPTTTEVVNPDVGCVVGTGRSPPCCDYGVTFGDQP